MNPLKHTYFPHSFYSPLFSSPTLFTALAMKNLPESFALSRALGKTPYPHTEHTAQHWLPIFTQFSSDANTRDLATHSHASIHTHTLVRKMIRLFSTASPQTRTWTAEQADSNYSFGSAPAALQLWFGRWKLEFSTQFCTAVTIGRARN